ncbi:conserved hypothetical protein [Ricinus communis]|uniref:Uncharacterized protein n=1 Tax=Ricinus communis TaxID=3988 RepID=B9RSF3_RICCO|nr:conserved hypothetical protein [Ricinus communis]
MTFKSVEGREGKGKGSKGLSLCQCAIVSCWVEGQPNQFPGSQSRQRLFSWVSPVLTHVLECGLRVSGAPTQFMLVGSTSLCEDRLTGPITINYPQSVIKAYMVYTNPTWTWTRIYT